MAIQVITIVRCDDCPSRYSVATGHKADAHKARKQAGMEWWAYLRRDGRMVDLCPSCRERQADLAFST